MFIVCTYLTVKFVESNMSGRQLIDLGYAGITIKKTKAAKRLEHKQIYLFNHFKTEGHTGFLKFSLARTAMARGPIVGPLKTLKLIFIELILK